MADAENYTLVFLKGSFTARADCNTVSGTWVSPSTGELSLAPTSSSGNDCGPDSLGDVYQADLAKAASYAIDSGTLKMTLSDEGTMSFK